MRFRGACDDKVTGSLVTCPNGVTACVIGNSYTSTAPTLYMRGCTDPTTPAKPMGCTSNVANGLTSKFCYCSADKCNENFGTAGASAVQFSLLAAILSAVLINQL
ncbi:uncharacterized protein LOC111699776 isoform X2 [Eurytemora carolleeae]|uniref:uncharacterized protein LOC111699776 isoform X2 n=1 Tax=Eurytemora carolleeae TaxID=1294199 RepID=UPI000C78DE72|nr:uncharacterized protein LOC111699776 isoform X2 [Eurytemora carolleeae]|eukprot:XP_023326277.1 uncharacterized protein LOC111699776 isoform X2 [Eurytemora affinis]